MNKRVMPRRPLDQRGVTISSPAAPRAIDQEATTSPPAGVQSYYPGKEVGQAFQPDKV